MKRWFSAGMTGILFLGAAVFSARAAEPPLTILDQTLRAAEADPELDGLYYRALLSTYLYIPTAAGGEESRNFSPLAYEMDNQPYVMVFDTLDRLTAWAGGRQIPHVRLPGYALVEAADSNVHWALNIGTDHVKLFIPDEIQWLKKSVKEFRRRVSPLDAGTAVEYKVPDYPPEGLVESLRSALRRSTQVQEAFLVSVQAMDKSFEQRMLLVVTISAENKKDQDTILMQLDSAALAALHGDQELVIAVADEKDPDALAARIARDIVPFYINRY